MISKTPADELCDELSGMMTNMKVIAPGGIKEEDVGDNTMAGGPQHDF